MSRFVESLGRKVLEFKSRARRGTLEFMGWYTLEDYLRSDRRFWRLGYYAYRKYLPGSISDLSTLEIFLKSNSLPSGYGFGLEASIG